MIRIVLFGIIGVMFVVSQSPGIEIENTNFCIKPLRLAYGVDWVPYNFENKDRSDKISGIDIEILVATLKDMNCTLKYETDIVPWKRQLHQIKTGEIDVILAASITEKRLNYALFSSPFRQGDYSLFILKKKAKTYSSKNIIDILANPKFNTLGIQTGYFYNEKMSEIRKKNQYKEKIKEIQGHEKLLKLLLAKRIDGMLIDTLVGINLLNKEKVFGNKVVISDVKPLIGASSHFMFSKKNISNEFVKAFNQSLVKLAKSGKVRAIVNKYGPKSSDIGSQE